ncbi:hypothetical protein B0H66DRAFT_164257 [Apodospora peruviana]|uniref:Uncharacterized protein n=1 Tax=Apodospora peruviana TaxID=516989 RepID=A0AAE0MBY1_9PEZI|nr:hypothetical protein B0H66DRAFT_164257 [Apodospora peruviana]
MLAGTPKDHAKCRVGFCAIERCVTGEDDSGAGGKPLVLQTLSASWLPLVHHTLAGLPRSTSQNLGIVRMISLGQHAGSQQPSVMMQRYPGAADHSKCARPEQGCSETRHDSILLLLGTLQSGVFTSIARGGGESAPAVSSCLHHGDINLDEKTSISDHGDHTAASQWISLTCRIAFAKTSPCRTSVRHLFLCSTCTEGLPCCRHLQRTDGTVSERRGFASTCVSGPLIKLGKLKDFGQ